MPHGDITHIEIPVSDNERAKSFYNALFGWQIEEYPGFEGYPMWRAPNQVSGGALVAREGDFTQPRSTIEVDSIEETLRAAETSGGKVIQGREPIDDSSWFAVMEDPDGNRIGLYEGTTDAGEGSES